MYGDTRPAVVVDRNRLPESGQRESDRTPGARPVEIFGLRLCSHPEAQFMVVAQPRYPRFLPPTFLACVNASWCKPFNTHCKPCCFELVATEEP